MELPTFFHSKSKRFYEISELAGKRWPNVTEDDIYNWHDAALEPYFLFHSPVKDLIRELWPQEELPDSVLGAMEEAGFDNGNLAGLVDAIKELWPEKDIPNGVIDAIEKRWLETWPPDSMLDAQAEFWEDNAGGLTDANLMGFWKFIPELTVLILKSEDEIKQASEAMKRCYQLAPIDTLHNSFFRINTSNVKGFSYNKEGTVSCSMVFDETGTMHLPAEFHSKTSKYIIGQVEIKKEELLIKESSVLLMEQIVPEITSRDFQADKKNILLPTSESSVSDIRSEARADEVNERGDLVLIGALLTLLKKTTNAEGETTGCFKNQTEMIATIKKRYPKIRQLGRRTLEKRFAKGNKAIERAVQNFKESISD